MLPRPTRRIQTLLAIQRKPLPGKPKPAAVISAKNQPPPYSPDINESYKRRFDGNNQACWRIEARSDHNVLRSAGIQKAFKLCAGAVNIICRFWKVLLGETVLKFFIRQPAVAVALPSLTTWIALSEVPKPNGSGTVTKSAWKPPPPESQREMAEQFHRPVWLPPIDSLPVLTALLSPAPMQATHGEMCSIQTTQSVFS